MEKKAIIFDMDGVILDSQAAYYEFDKLLLWRCAAREELREAGFAWSADLVTEAARQNAGLTTLDRMARYKKEFGLKESAEALAEICAGYARKHFETARIEPLGGMPELLSYAKELGLQIGVASSTPLALVRLILERLGLLHFFAKIVSGEDVAAGKPAPDVYLKAAAALGLLPGECWAVEDSLAGMRSAKAAGMGCIAYRNSYTQDYSHADHVVGHFSECRRILAAPCND